MIRIYSPRNVEELDILRSMLSEAGIRFLVHNNAFGFMFPASKLEHFSTTLSCFTTTITGEL